MGSCKKVMVTGSLGYIGSVLTAYLTEHNFECVGYDTGFFKDCQLYPPREQKTILKDLRDLNRDDLKGVDAVVHLAAMSNDPLMSFAPERFYDPVRRYSVELAGLCKDMGIKFIFASSCSIYGRGGEELLTEESETDPQTPYALNKFQIENDLREISDRKFSPIILRFSTVYGLSPRMRFDVVINMLTGMAVTAKKIILNSDGKAWRSFIHIRDICKAIGYCLEYEYKSDKPLILNVGDTAENYQIIDIVEMIKDEIPDCDITYLRDIRGDSPSDGMSLIEDRKIQDGVDTRTYKVSSERIKKTLSGFRCDWSVKRGIRDMISEFKKMKLTEEQFSKIDFYRLQKMEYLLKNRYLSADLFWINAT